MILVATALACVLSVPLTGGRLMRLVDLPLRAGWAALAALGLQVLITTWAPADSVELLKGLHLATYALAVVYIVANAGITGLPVLALGAALNLAAITANGGVMPASEAAMRIAGLGASDDFANSAPVADPQLLFLGDVIPIPGPWPLGNVVSVGDLLIMLGLLVVLHSACRAPKATVTSPVRARESEPAQPASTDPGVITAE